MEESLPINDQLTIPGNELWVTASLSGGPGGQHVNKVHSRITLHWNVHTSTAVSDIVRTEIVYRLENRISNDGILHISVDSHRSQHRNREEARTRLAALIASAIQPQKKRIPTRISLLAKRRRLNAKRHRGLAKQMRKRPESNEY
ncbi:MAG: aminoacyl-tRNA hydrolase [Deltaproteobacteria bacterium]|nr:aminoacyl-tRNA hydrolase [Deltaproteobacteria bacterium]MBN2673817.1 aminoacyl-tRNA hydrolase [Deltaproteobacteria bacterium]